MTGSSGILHYLETSDAITHGVAYVLLAMSIASWCFLIVKSWILTRAKRQATPAIAQFWQAPTLAEGVAALRRVDRERVFTPLAEAALHAAEVDIPGALLARVERGERVLRALRVRSAALERLVVLERLVPWAQVLLEHLAGWVRLVPRESAVQPALRVRLVLQERPGDFPKSARLREGLAPLLGRSVFVTNGALWERQRRIIDPAFEGGRLRETFPAIRAAAACRPVKPNSSSRLEALASRPVASFVCSFSRDTDWSTRSESSAAWA